jgi:UDP-glucuronate 4-epimerase
MAYFRLIAAAMTQWNFELSGTGSIRRDFTYISDTVSSLEALCEDLYRRDEGFHDVVNVGGGQPRSMNELIEVIQELTGRQLEITRTSPQRVDPQLTDADFSYLVSITGHKPTVRIEEGLRDCLEWAQSTENRVNLRNWIVGNTAS